jgi:hypothetical protein
VYASNHARFEQGFNYIADRAKIAGRQDEGVDIFKLVHDWMCEDTNKWLLILDNLDDAQYLLETESGEENQAPISTKATRPLLEYLPRCAWGSILITSRYKQAAQRLVYQCDIIDVNPMSSEQALALLKTKMVERQDENDVIKLAAVLENMPLAIVQAAAFISQKAPLYTAKKYLDLFETDERQRNFLLDYDSEQLRRGWGSTPSTLGTWKISFEHLQQVRPSAADLLALMSFFDRQGIPGFLLKTKIDSQSQDQRHNASWDREESPSRMEIDQEADTPNSEMDMSEMHFNDEDDVWESMLSDPEFSDDLSALRNFCLISVESTGVFEMHALVQLATRKWLEEKGKLEQWKQKFLDNLCAAFPSGDYDNWSKCQRLFAHAKSALAQPPKNTKSLETWAILLYNAAEYAASVGKVSDAILLAKKSMETREQVLGPEHKETLLSMRQLAQAYQLAGLEDDVEDLQLILLHFYRDEYGDDHIDTVISKSELAWTYTQQNRWDEAESLQIAVDKYTCEKLGYFHHESLGSMSALAKTYYNRYEIAAAQGFRYKPVGLLAEAERLHTFVSQVRSRDLTAYHPDTLISKSNLAATWKLQGKISQAMELMRECVLLGNDVFPPSHPDYTDFPTRLAQWEAEFPGY